MAFFSTFYLYPLTFHLLFLSVLRSAYSFLARSWAAMWMASQAPPKGGA
jgi:hypothetical protein